MSYDKKLSLQCLGNSSELFQKTLHMYLKTYSKLNFFLKYLHRLLCTTLSAFFVCIRYISSNSADHPPPNTRLTIKWRSTQLWQQFTRAAPLPSVLPQKFHRKKKHTLIYVSFYFEVLRNKWNSRPFTRWTRAQRIMKYAMGLYEDWGISIVRNMKCVRALYEDWVVSIVRIMKYVMALYEDWGINIVRIMKCVRALYQELALGAHEDFAVDWSRWFTFYVIRKLLKQE